MHKSTQRIQAYTCILLVTICEYTDMHASNAECSRQRHECTTQRARTHTEAEEESERPERFDAHTFERKTLLLLILYICLCSSSDCLPLSLALFHARARSLLFYFYFFFYFFLYFFFSFFWFVVTSYNTFTEFFYSPLAYIFFFYFLHFYFVSCSCRILFYKRRHYSCLRLFFSLLSRFTI